MDCGLQATQVHGWVALMTGVVCMPSPPGFLGALGVVWSGHTCSLRATHRLHFPRGLVVGVLRQQLESYLVDLAKSSQTHLYRKHHTVSHVNLSINQFIKHYVYI